MKSINYTGNSKLITRIVHLLNRKAPLPLDGDGDAEWGTNGQVLTTDGNGNTSWTTPQGGGGDVTDVEVNGTSVVNAQGVAEVSVPTATSDLNNDSGFIDGTDLSTALSDYTPTSGLATVATSGSYNDLSNKPTIPAAQVNSDWNAVSGVAEILNKPTIPTALADLSEDTTHRVVTDTEKSTWNGKVSDNPTFTEAATRANIASGESFATILGKIKKFFADLKTVAFTGSYNDLTNKPTIPAAQIQSDWNQSDTTAKDYIKNKPTIPTVTKTVFYGTCTGQAANQTKAVVVDSSQSFTLTAGIILLVKFDANNTYSATADAPVKLNVNSTGAINIYYAGSNAPTGTNTTAFGRTNYVNQYYYDGTNWIWSGSSADNNTTYSNMSANELTTGTATTARSISAKVLTDWLVAKLTNVAYTNTINYFRKAQVLDRQDGTTSAIGYSAFIAGNSTPAGTDKNSRGQYILYGDGANYTALQAPSSTAVRTISFPDADGTVALTSDLTWRYLNTFTITDTTTGTVAIPSGVKEILVSVGSNNNGQVFGGKNFVMQNTMPQYDIIVTGELINGSGTIVSTKGVYLGYNANNTLTYRALDIVSGRTLAMRIYYR